MEQKEYARMFPAKTHLEAAVRVQKEKLHKNRHVAARQAIDRSLEEVDEVIQGGDAAEIEELHRQLEKQREAMTATAVHARVPDIQVRCETRCVLLLMQWQSVKLMKLKLSKTKKMFMQMQIQMRKGLLKLILI
jgi:hypothetical protein